VILQKEDLPGRVFLRRVEDLSHELGMSFVFKKFPYGFQRFFEGRISSYTLPKLIVRYAESSGCPRKAAAIPVVGLENGINGGKISG
jgi:hypothetical protein